jgi:hypothetical protein
MTLKQALEKLKSLGHEKVRLQNKKSGADDNQYGGKNGDIRTIQHRQVAPHHLYRYGSMKW